MHRPTASASHSIDQHKPACAAEHSTGNVIGHSFPAIAGRFCVLMLANVIASIFTSTTAVGPSIVSIGAYCDGVVAVWCECCAAVDSGLFSDFCGLFRPRDHQRNKKAPPKRGRSITRANS
jgi:hypothetical protein